MTSTRSPVTALLDEWSAGNSHALDELMELVVNDLRIIARNLLRREFDNWTLEPTELVNEVYLQLAAKRTVKWESSRQFFGEMGRMIRRILVDRVRARRRIKRGGGLRPISIDALPLLSNREHKEIEALDDALDALAKRDERQSKIVELRYFIGLEIDEIAAIFEVSPRTIRRDWRTAKIWLYRELIRD